MAVVQRLGLVCGWGWGSGARGAGRPILLIVIAAMLWLAPVVRAADEVQWVPPAALDDVPVRAAALPPDAAQPEPIVVPLPSGLETGAMSLAAMAAVRWWVMRRRA